MVTAPHLSAISPARLCHHRQISEACISTNNNVFSFNTTYFRDNDSGSVGNVQAAVVSMYPAPPDNSNPGNSAPIFSHSLCEWCDICSE